MSNKIRNRTTYVIKDDRRLKIKDKKQKSNPISGIKKNVLLVVSSIINMIIFSNCDSRFSHHCQLYPVRHSVSNSWLGDISYAKQNMLK
ncbi:MAG: hypothetical protein WC587_00015 [Candidatus Paceibacterota bacterium]